MHARPNTAVKRAIVAAFLIFSFLVLILIFLPVHTSRSEDADIVRVIFAADGKEILGGTRDGRVYLWNVEDGHLIDFHCIRQSYLNRAPAPLNSIALAPQGQLIATAGRSLSLFAANANREGSLPLSVPDFAFGALSFSPDASTLVAASSNERLLLWRLNRSSAPLDLGSADAGVYGATAFSADGQNFVSAGHTLRMLSADTGQEHWHGPRDGYAFLSVAFRPDGKAIATGSQDASIRIWNSADGAEMSRLKGQQGYVDAVAFSPSGLQLVSWARDGQLSLWQLAPSTHPYTSLGVTTGDAAFSPDGRWIASGGPSLSILFWDVASKTRIKTFRGNADAPLGCQSR
jgi:WD40 repeat protein